MQKSIKKIAYSIITGYLRNQTKRLLKKNPELIVIAVTGSVGKTTTKRAIATVLSQKYKVIAHPGNYNTRIGLPLSLFELESPGSVLRPSEWVKIWWQIEKKIKAGYPYEVAVVEMGADAVGHIGEFMKFINPDFGVVTAVKPSHLEGFKTMANIRNEKLKLASGSRQALICADDQKLVNFVRKLKLDNPIFYGSEKGEYRFETKEFLGDRGFRGVMHMRDKSFPMRTGVIAKHNIHVLVAAAAMGDLLGLSIGNIKKGLAQISPVAGRMNPLPGINGSLIIDDTYNANPEAVTSALDTLYSLKGRKIALLGMMNEMDSYSKKYHQDIGHYASRVDLLLTVGKDARKYILPAAIEAGLAPPKTHSFKSPYEAGHWLKDKIRSKDIILVKGSQGGVFLEEAVSILLANKKDRKKLVRQSPFWMNVKKAVVYEK